MLKLIISSSFYISLPLVYWSWNGGPREGRGMEALEKRGQISGGGGAGGGWDSIYENDQSAKVNNIELGIDLFRFSAEITGADWPFAKAITSPCPTLKVIGAISQAMIAREELKRMAERPGFNADGTPIRVSTIAKTKVVADKVVGGVMRNTVGRAAKFFSRRILGEVPETALTGSYQQEKKKSQKVQPIVPIQTETSTAVSVLPVSEAEQKALADEISKQLSVDKAEQSTMKTDQELIEEVMKEKSAPISTV